MAVASTSQPGDSEDEKAFLDSVDGEISFFRSIMRARPIGIHRFFHVLAIQNAMHKDTGRKIRIESIWKKLRSCYDMDALDAIDIEAEGYFIPSNNSTPISIRSPSPSENLSNHPFFREEFQIPYDDTIENIISQRRMRATASAPSTPAASSPPPVPPPAKRQKVGRKRGKSKSKLNLAGLVGGDSDSSALTQESGDEGQPETPRDSVITGTDGGTDYADDEDAEMREPSAARSASPNPNPGPRRGRPPKSAKRGRGGSRGTASARGLKKRKR